MWHNDSAWEHKTTEQYQANGYGICTFSDKQELSGYFQVSCTQKTTTPKSYPHIEYSLDYYTLVDMKLELKGILPKLEIISFDFMVASFQTDNLNTHRNHLEALVNNRLTCGYKFSKPFILDKITEITATNLEITLKLVEDAPLLLQSTK